MLEYMIFFGLLFIALVFYILFELRPKEKIMLDVERLKTESPIERRVYDCLVARGEYVKTQVPCGRYRIDLALPVERIAIECDGKQFHSSSEDRARDRRKDIVLRKNGWKILRFSGSVIVRDLKSVVQRIEKEKSSLQK